MVRPVAVLLAVAVTLALLGAGWQWLVINDIVTIASLQEWLMASSQWRSSVWAVWGVLAIYCVALLTLFPLSLLVAATGLVFGPAWGFCYATVGTLASSAVSYWVGKRLGQEALLHYGGKRLKGLSGYLGARGVRTMVLINLLPLAPFTLTNMMAGAFRIRFRDYMLGSTLGILPGLAAVTLLGSQLGALLLASEARDVVLPLVGLGVAVGLLWALRRYSRRQPAV